MLSVFCVVWNRHTDTEILRAAWWFFDHLDGQIPIVVLSSHAEPCGLGEGGAPLKCISQALMERNTSKVGPIAIA